MGGTHARLGAIGAVALLLGACEAGGALGGLVPGAGQHAVLPPSGSAQPPQDAGSPDDAATPDDAAAPADLAELPDLALPADLAPQLDFGCWGNNTPCDPNHPRDHMCCSGSCGPHDPLWDGGFRISYWCVAEATQPCLEDRNCASRQCVNGRCL